jgi:uncharacterized membrane protein YcaP (DUF421 family)
MKDILIDIFGQGKELSVFQMCMRTVLVFVITLLFIRLSGKRSFGMRMPLDNVITILLGALLSRAIVGASPFFPTIASGFVIVILYRIFAGLSVFSKLFGKLVKGKGVLIYKDGELFKDRMTKCMVTKEDLIEELRINSNLGTLDEAKAIYIERNGEISVVKKEKQ